MLKTAIRKLITALLNSYNFEVRRSHVAQHEAAVLNSLRLEIEGLRKSHQVLESQNNKIEEKLLIQVTEAEKLYEQKNILTAELTVVQHAKEIAEKNLKDLEVSSDIRASLDSEKISAVHRELAEAKAENQRLRKEGESALAAKVAELAKAEAENQRLRE